MQQRRPDPIPALKRRVADEILLLLDSWSQANAACLMGAWQPRVSELRAGHLHRFSLDRLVRYLAHLDREVTIVSKRIIRLSVVNHRAVDGPKMPTVAEFRAAHEHARAAAKAAAATSAAAASADIP